jgi:hypothetical protein
MQRTSATSSSPAVVQHRPVLSILTSVPQKSQHEKCTRRGSGGEHNSCHCQSQSNRPSPQPAPRTPRNWQSCSRSSSEAWRRHPRPLVALWGVFPLDFCFPDPPGRDHSSSAAVLVRVVFSLSSLLACRHAAATDRTGSQPATTSINQHHPSWSTLTAALARCCTSNHNLQATGHGAWDMAIAHRPIAHLAKPQQGPPNGRRTSEQQRP